MNKEEEFEEWFNQQSPMFSRGNRVIAYEAWSYFYHDAKRWQFVRAQVAKDAGVTENQIDQEVWERQHGKT